jgi:hypothetical protein
MEVLGPMPNNLKNIEQNCTLVSGDRFIDLISLVSQTIEGEFLGYNSVRDSTPALVLRAVDSSYFDVLSDDEDLLDLIKHRFREVTPPKEWPGYPH